jgi:undecaprenyl-diphosphatase
VLVTLVLVVPAVALGALAAWGAARLGRRGVTVATLLRVDLAVLVGGIVVLGVVLVLVDHDTFPVSVDRDVAHWARANATAVTDDVLELLTDLGSRPALVVLGLLAFVVDLVRRPRPSIATAAFLAVVIAFEPLLTGAVKGSIDRVRPPAGVAADLGAAFPSGHAAGAAAVFAAAALVIGLTSSPRARVMLAGVAVGVAVAVATTRVLLGVHWLTDALAGLALGWAWCALAALAFGRWLGVGVGVGTDAPRARATPDRHDDGRASTARGERDRS